MADCNEMKKRVKTAKINEQEKNIMNVFHIICVCVSMSMCVCKSECLYGGG